MKNIPQIALTPYLHVLNLRNALPLSYKRLITAMTAFGAASSSLGAADVDGGSNLATYLNAATQANHEFNLLGDVTLDAYVSQNNAAKKDLFVEGNNHLITLTSATRNFRITSGVANPVLTIRNARITNSSTSSSNGAIYIESGANNATVDLQGSTIFGTHSGSANYGGALTSRATTTATVKGSVTFDANYGSGDAAGAVAVSNGSNLVFEGATNFTNNYTYRYGGAVSVFTNSSVTFQEHATFTGNRVDRYFGGAIDVWTANGLVRFENGSTFTGNFARNIESQSYGVRGGAINVGYIAGTGREQLQMLGVSDFTGNYVWGLNTTVGVGGAISLAAPISDPLSNSQLNSSHVYGADIEQGIFTDNYAFSENGSAYGGALFVKSYQSVVKFGSGSTFTGNMAKTLGGAIYFDQGTLNLSGNINFSGNRHGVTFSTVGNVLTPDRNSGRANAIYFSVDTNTATLNLDTKADEVIRFEDPIESAAGKTVTVNKTGSGTVIFVGYDSDILAQTSVSEGTFELGAGVAYGRRGNNENSTFHLAHQATLRGGANATLRASKIELDGRIEVEEGQFNFDGADVVLAATSVIALTIVDIANYSSIDMGGNSLEINNAVLEITATNYLPSQNFSDSFILVSNLSEAASGMFLQGESIMINGAEFAIIYDATSIILQQIVVPEPSTYGLILAAAIAGGVWLRRQKKGKRIA